MNQIPSRHLSTLASLAPDWATGGAGRGLMLRHLQVLTTYSLPVEIHAWTKATANWRWQLLPWERLPDRVAELVQHQKEYASWSKFPPDAATFTRVMHAIASGDSAIIEREWTLRGARSANAAWLGETFLFFLRQADTDMCEFVLRSTALESSHPVVLYLNALRSFAFDPEDQACQTISTLAQQWEPLQHYLLAELLIRQGQPLGVKILTSLWQKMPWHVNLTLKLHDLLSTRPKSERPDHRIAVCVYTWNNADLLAQTLESLAQSEMGAARIFILDNGSADHTPEIILKANATFGERLTSMRLPVNIGAPSARNWLLFHPDLANIENLVFLDDDVFLPRTWLRQILEAGTRHPECSAIGCRIMDRPPSNCLQTADVNLLDFDGGNDFQIANTGGGEPDIGLHTYSRPCLSVTGCCHLLRRSRMNSQGGFDPRFTPSQFDDFDLDLRNALHGGHAVYAGNVAIRHCQRSSLNQADSEAKQGHIQGNMLKLNTKYSAAQKAELLRRNRELLWDDLLAKTRDLESL